MVGYRYIVVSYVFLFFKLTVNMTVVKRGKENSTVSQGDFVHFSLYLFDELHIL